MALKSNRVGVRTDQVDVYGRITSKSFLQSILDHLPRWTSLKVWKNGTEQLLPVNTDEPVTSPIVADIQYPTDSSATEQMFTYRVSPTDVDGEAYIKSIKGNTIVWNQLIQNGNFADTSNWNTTGGSVSASNNVVTFTVESISGAYLSQVVNVPIGHKFFFSAEVKSDDITSSNNLAFGNAQTLVTKTLTNSWQTYSGIANKEISNSNFNVIRCTSGLTVGATINAKNCMLIDLTAMFGSTKADEIYAMETAQAGSGVAYFKSLFPLSYYKYDAGSLLSFNGSGIKTVGKNLVDLSSFADEFCTYENGVLTGTTNRLANKVYPIPFGKQVTIQAKAYTDGNSSTTGWGLYIGLHYSDGTAERARWSNDTSSYTYGTITSDSSKTPIEIYLGYGASGQNIWHIKELQVEFGTTATSYEPYTTSTTTIPTDTYFPTGMKSAGNAFDELTNSKAYTRIGTLNIGSDIPTGTDGLRNIAELTNCVRFEYYPFRSVGKGASIAISDRFVMGDTGTESGVAFNMGTGSATDQPRLFMCLPSTYNTDELIRQWFAENPTVVYYELVEEIIEPTLTFDEE